MKVKITLNIELPDDFGNHQETNLAVFEEVVNELSCLHREKQLYWQTDGRDIAQANDIVEHHKFWQEVLNNKSYKIEIE